MTDLHVTAEIREGQDGRWHVYALLPFGFIKEAFDTRDEANVDAVARRFAAHFSR